MLDTRIYRQIASQLGAEGWVPTQAFFMSPLYPYLMAATGAADGGPARGATSVRKKRRRRERGRQKKRRPGRLSGIEAASFCPPEGEHVPRRKVWR